MLSSNVQATPRPRPPAKVRRSPSLNFPPPPPYAPRSDVLLNSPIAVTAQLLGTVASEDIANGLPQVVEEWMNEKSKEELSDLLLKADGLIKERETELGLTSALVKTLYHNNIALKTKHEALLSRLPTNRPSSPAVTSVALALDHSPHFYTASLPHTPVDSPQSHSPTLSRLRPQRTVSVTPAEIAVLADQNAELLDKLEKLEEESERNDRLGRRKLRKLEKEIQALRTELEETQANEQESSEKAKILSEAELQRRKEEREERLRCYKEQSIPETDSLETIRDFAPAPELPRSVSGKVAITSAAVPPPPAVNMATRPTLESSLLTSPPSSQPSPTMSPPRPEYALISQLLRKIQELEETNAQITTEQKVTAERLHAAQRDADSIRKAYDFLDSDSSDVCIVDGSPVVPLAGSVEEATNSNNLRHTMEGEVDPSLDGDVGEEDFFMGIADDMRSTTRHVLPPPANKTAPGHRSRKSVVGLFDSPDSGRVVSSGPYPAGLGVSPSFRSGGFVSGEVADMSAWSTAAVDSSFDDGSPTPSTLGLTLPAPSDFGSLAHRKQTLGSELGSEFGDDWGRNAGNYHLRASSLYDLTQITTASKDHASSPADEDHMAFHTPTGSPPSESVWEDIEDSPSPDPTTSSVTEAATPSRRKRMSLVIDPPTPSPKSNRNSLVLREARSLRNLRLSETMRARTSRWVEGRYGDATLSVPIRRRRSTRSSAHGHGSRGSDASMIFTETFDVVVRQLSFKGELAEEEEEVPLEPDNRVAVVENTNTAVALPPRKEGFVGFILEVWLWLQFAIVVVVFLWAMARRGPKSVLKEAEKRKASGSVRR